MRKDQGMTLQEFTTLVTRCSSNWMILLILYQSLHKLCLHCQKLLNSWWWWWWMWGNTFTTSASSSSRHLTSNINVQNLEISKLEYILKIFWTSSNISSSVKQSYLKFQKSKRGVLYMVGKLKNLSTMFIQTTFPDSVVRLLKNSIQPKLFQIPACAETLS